MHWGAAAAAAGVGRLSGPALAVPGLSNPGITFLCRPDSPATASTGTYAPAFCHSSSGHSGRQNLAVLHASVCKVLAHGWLGCGLGACCMPVGCCCNISPCAYQLLARQGGDMKLDEYFQNEAGVQRAGSKCEQ